MSLAGSTFAPSIAGVPGGVSFHTPQQKLTTLAPRITHASDAIFKSAAREMGAPA